MSKRKRDTGTEGAKEREKSHKLARTTWSAFDTGPIELDACVRSAIVDTLDLYGIRNPIARLVYEFAAPTRRGELDMTLSGRALFSLGKLLPLLAEYGEECVMNISKFGTIGTIDMNVMERSRCCLFHVTWLDQCDALHTISENVVCSLHTGHFGKFCKEIIDDGVPARLSLSLESSVTTDQKRSVVVESIQTQSPYIEQHIQFVGNNQTDFIVMPAIDWTTSIQLNGVDVAAAIRILQRVSSLNVNLSVASLEPQLVFEHDNKEKKPQKITKLPGTHMTKQQQPLVVSHMFTVKYLLIGLEVFHKSGVNHVNFILCHNMPIRICNNASTNAWPPFEMTYVVVPLDAKLKVT